jgi:predicted AlkP superfamily phosphohydrolase/phosphomutase
MGMRIFLIEWPGATPEGLLGDEDLANVRRLMAAGVFGPLTSVVPPTTAPASACLATGLDPGALGVYGPEDRADRSYAPPRASDPAAPGAPAWTDLARLRGRRAFRVGTPAEPAATGEAASSPDDLLAAVRRDVAAARERLDAGDWDILHLVVGGPGRLVGGDGLRAFARGLDDEIGDLLGRLTEEAVVAIASPHGSRPIEGGFALNDWLVREGLLVLGSEPREPAPLESLDVDWGRTTAWALGGGVGRVWLNVRGREPGGRVEPSEFGRVRDDLAARLEAAVGADGRPLGAVALRPESLYREARGVPPDLIVHPGERAWRALGEVGYPGPDVPPDPAWRHRTLPTPLGAFVLAGPGVPALGEIPGVHVLDLAPTLLRLAGLEVPEGLRSASALATALGSSTTVADADEFESLVRDRLSGLGYV